MIARMISAAKLSLAGSKFIAVAEYVGDKGGVSATVT